MCLLKLLYSVVGRLLPENCFSLKPLESLDFGHSRTKDRDQRIQLARLTARQATKYRRTLAVLEMTGSGLRTAEIA